MKDIEIKELNIPKDQFDGRVVAFNNECIDCVELYARKNHDYGDSFHKAMNELGMSYAVGKLFDKTNRLIALCGKEETSRVKDESYDDTLRDLACYAIMTLAYRHYGCGDKD